MAESGLQHKGYLARFRNPAKDSFSGFGIATNNSLIRNQDCNRNIHSSRGLQHLFHSSRVRIATEILIPPESKGTLAIL
jgi:hypothetical protein